MGKLLTPSKISAWLECSHYLTLRRRADAGEISETNTTFGTFAQLIADKGVEHEADCLDAYERDGRPVCRVPPRDTDETFEAWAARSLPLLAGGHDVLYQFPLVHEGVRGIADFLVRAEGPEGAMFSYEPVDAKLARVEAAPGHVLQLCFYADALAVLQGHEPTTLRLMLGSGREVTVPFGTVRSYWRRLRRRLITALAEESGDTQPVPCGHCGFCEFADRCESEWRDRDALHFTAGIRSSEQDDLSAAGVATMRQLAARLDAVTGLRPERLQVLQRQAALQRAAVPGEPPPIEPLDDILRDDTERARLPKPDDGDIFLDFEGHPFFAPSRGLFFLFGHIELDPATGTWSYRASWAHDTEGEAAAARLLIDSIVQRRLAHPGMHVYHYNHTERTALEGLAREHGVGEQQLAELIRAGVFVDVLDVVRRTLLVGAESYSLKVLEQVAGYSRGHDIDKGAGAVVAYERWRSTKDGELLDQVARYNEDDVRATRAVRDWLLDGLLDGAPHRLDPTVDDLDEPDVDEIVEALMASEEEWKVLLAHTLGYWSRERRTYFTQRVALLDGDIDDQLRHPEIIGNCSFVGFVPPVGRQIHPGAVFEFPPQQLERSLLAGAGTGLAFPIVDGGYRSVGIRELDWAARRITVSWNEASMPDGAIPSAFVATKYIGPKAKPAELASFAERVVAESTTDADAVRIALLKRDVPMIGPSRVAVDRVGSGISELRDLAGKLNGSLVAVQGPPGTGKTYTGTQVASTLIDAGKRIGVTAFSHEAINNFLRALIAIRPGVSILRQGAAPNDERQQLDGATYGFTRAKWDKGTFDVLAGTTWMFANGDLTVDAPIDVLFVDEAGQLGLADTLAALGSAKNAVLLGDPLQLAQVTQAVHPGGAGASALEHMLGGHATMPPERGAFLATTYRMHPSITRFISDQIYDGLLTSAPSCAQQSVNGSAGLRWVRASHTGRSKSSPEEAAIVQSIARSLIGKPWVDQAGTTSVLGVDDMKVVAPYNEHADLVRAALDADPATAGVRVGTVDKFQGQEAPVVIFSMATSSGEHMPRTADFLFSRNRLNVAVSRAKALAYIVCTEELLDTRASDIAEMLLIGTLCDFVESAEHVRFADDV